MIEPAKYKLSVWRGATFRKTLTLFAPDGSPQDLTGYSGELDIRSSPNDPTILLSLTTSNGGVINGGTTGVIQLFIDSTVTQAATWSTAYYELKLTDTSNNTDVYLFGPFVIQG